jgi:hypothetical protein
MKTDRSRRVSPRHRTRSKHNTNSPDQTAETMGPSREPDWPTSTVKECPCAPPTRS